MPLAQATADTAERRRHLSAAGRLHSLNAPVIVVGSTWRPWGAGTRLGNVPDDITFSGLHGAWARPVFHEQILIRHPPTP